MKFRKYIALLLILTMVAPQFALYSAEEGEYIIGPLDELMIRVVNNTEFDKQVQVALDGFILFPPIQEAIEASGNTADSLSLKISNLLQKFISGGAPEVKINILKYNSRRVSVLGMVQQPGVYGFVSIPNMMGVLLRAGGPLPQAALTEVRVLRGDKDNPQIITVDVAKFLKNGDFSLLPQLIPGDVVFVPAQVPKPAQPEATVYDTTATREEEEAKVIHILGEVFKPGNYLLPEDKKQIDLVEALLVAGGGPNQIADLEHISIIRHKRENDKVNYQVEVVDHNSYLVNGDLKGNPPIYPGDTITVPMASIDGPYSTNRRPKNKIIFVAGEVLRPGSYMIEADDNIWKAVALAGGPTIESNLRSSSLVSRNANGQDSHVPVNLAKVIKGKISSPILNDWDTIIVGRKKHFWREFVTIIRDLSSVAIAYGTISLAAEQAKTNAKK